jgi:hypothetical protein
MGYQQSSKRGPKYSGYATSISVNGETVYFKVKTDATDYRLDIYRLGYYPIDETGMLLPVGRGARKVASITPSVPLPQTQPDEPLREKDADGNDPSGLADYGNWAVSAHWDVPNDATSGVYIARLVRQDTQLDPPPASHIVFIVRDDEGSSDLLFQTSDTTWHAYNCWPADSSGVCRGNSLYDGLVVGRARAYKVGYNRPFATRGDYYRWSFLFWAEYPMIRWLERNGYDVSYFTGVDSDLRGDKILKHKVFPSVGHDEYWSKRQRDNVESARDLGVHLAFFSGNEVFWKTRWEESLDGSRTPNRTLVCYKETHAKAKIDPASEWTGTWRDPRFSPPADGGRPENELVGAIFTVNGPIYRELTVPSAYGRVRFWRNTDIAALPPGDTYAFAPGILGYEWGEDLDNGFRPKGVLHLSLSTYPNVPCIADFGSTYVPGTSTHHLVLHRADSGALVFGASTVQWAFGLDDQHDELPAVSNLRMQQATMNLLADMDVQPGSLQGDLIAATKSTDRTAPVSVITSPTDGVTVQTGTAIPITGTATDEEGVVGNVEVSVDGGATWHPATGSTNWSYIWTPTVLGSIVIKSLAVDDSANRETPSSGVTVTVVAPS